MRLLALAVLLDVLTTLAGLRLGLAEAGLIINIVYARLGLALGFITHYIIEYSSFRLLYHLITWLRPDVSPSSAVMLAAVYPSLVAGHNLGILFRVLEV